MPIQNCIAILINCTSMQIRIGYEKGAHVENTRLIAAKEMAEDPGASVQCAYNIIRQLNSELAEDGCFVIKGKTNRHYYEQRFFSFLSEAEIEEDLK